MGGVGCAGGRAIVQRDGELAVSCVVRLVTRQLWRAFPELDRFDDATCRRFVKAAGAGWRGALIPLASVLVGVGIVIAGLWFGLSTWRGSHVLRAMGQVAFFGGALVGPVAGYVLRDVLMRRQVRRVLRVRGVCRACGYSLVGLSVPDSLMVVCPECGVQSAVHASIGVLGEKAQGERRIDAETDLVWNERHRRRWLSDAARRRVRKTVRWSAIGLVCGVVLGMASYEIFLRWQAGRARAGKVASARFIALNESMQPMGLTLGEASSWDVLRRAPSQLEDLDKQLVMRLIEDGNRRPGPLQLDFFSLLRAPYRDSAGLIDQTTLEYMRESQLAYDAYAQGGMDEVLRELATTRGSRHDFRSVMQWPQVEPDWELISPARVLVMYAHVRMDDAVLLEDRAGWLAAFEGALAVSRTQYAGGSVGSSIWGGYNELATLRELSVVLSRHPDPQTLDMIEAAMARQRPASDEFSYAIACELLRGEHLAATVFEDVGKCRWGRFSAYTRRAIGKRYFEVSMGTYAGTRRVLRESLDAVEAKLGQSAAHRTLWAAGGLTDTGYEPARATVVGSILQPADQFVAMLMVASEVRAAREAARVQVALERYWHDHGKAYPACLEELVPAYLEKVPVDDWDPRGGAMRYRLVDARRDAQGRGYLLYSVGRDGIDHGGVPTSQHALVAMPGVAARMSDYVWNDARRE